MRRTPPLTMLRMFTAAIFMYGVRTPLGECFSIDSIWRRVTARTETAVPRATIFAIVSCGIG
ncbi:MAG: hypothetical protein IPP20_04465 [Gemmatimonadetes bacterium]|nr:hypothetical protein [Gemmatimonadota bacterium]